MALNLIMLGAPGAGKGTQAERFARAHSIPRVSTGDILREAVPAGTEIGRRAKAIMDRGELVSDEVIVGIVRGAAGPGGRRERIHSRRVSANGGAGHRARRIMSGRGPLVVVDIVVPEEELVRTAGVAAGVRDVRHERGARERQALRPVRRPARAARGRQPGGGAGAAGGLQAEDGPLVEFYRGRPTFCTIDGRRRPIVSPRRLETALIGRRHDRSRGAVAERSGDRLPVRAELERMREAGRLVGEVLTGAPRRRWRRASSTAELDELAEKRIVAAGAVPAFKGYRGYPATICASINDEVIHGIPSGASDPG